jgi:hypothetical protein
MTKNGAGRTFWLLFLQPVIENRGGDGFLGTGMAKNKFCTDMLDLLSPQNLSKSFLGAYECKSRFCPLGHSSAVVAVVFVVIEKTGSPVFFLSFLH